jgi:uncharacterized membrane protein
VKKLGRILAVSATIAYPFAVLACLLVFKVSARGIGLCLLAVAALNFLSLSGPSGGEGAVSARARKWGGLGLSLLLVALVFITDNAAFAKIYPVVVSLVLLSLFGFSLAKGPTMIFRLACLQDKSLREAGSARDKAEPYCRKVTLVWCCFFVANASGALYTALWASPLAWTVYNGFVSYILIGALLLGEMLVRRRAMKS